MWILTLVYALLLLIGFVFLYKMINQQQRIESGVERLEKAMREEEQ